VVSYAVPDGYAQGPRLTRGRAYLRRLVDHPEVRRSVRWVELKPALEAEGFTLRMSRRGAHAVTCYHPNHPRRAILTIALPHSNRGVGETIRIGYIRDLCQYLEELWTIEEGNLGD
jgi:plasmid stabilization system protein ParE